MVAPGIIHAPREDLEGRVVDGLRRLQKGVYPGLPANRPCEIMSAGHYRSFRVRHRCYGSFEQSTSHMHISYCVKRQRYPLKYLVFTNGRPTTFASRSLFLTSTLTSFPFLWCPDWTYPMAIFCESVGEGIPDVTIPKNRRLGCSISGSHTRNNGTNLCAPFFSENLGTL